MQAKMALEKEAADEDLHSSDIESILIHKDRLYTAADDGKVKVWSTKDLSLISQLKAHDYAIYHLLILDGDTLFTASIDQTIKAWELDSLALKGTFTGHEEGVHRLATDGQFLFSGDDKGEVRKWTKDGKLLLQFGLIEEIWDLYVIDKQIFTIRDKDLIVAQLQDVSDKYSIKFAHPGRAPLVVTEELVAFPDRTGKEINIIERNSEGFIKKNVLEKHEMIITVMSTWSHFLVSSGYDQQILLWDLEKGSCIGSCPVKQTPSAMATSGDGFIFIGGPDGYLAKYKVT